MSETKPSPLPSFLVCQMLCFLASFIGSQAAFIGLQAWYPAITKPAFAPPNWSFAPVWTLLYFLMGVSLFQVWRSDSSRSRTWGLWFFGFQLILNALWSWIFFAWNLLPVAFWALIILDVAILATIVAFKSVRGSAAMLLAPYLAWCLFASALTFSIWKLNVVNITETENSVQIKIGEPELTPLPN